MRLSICLLALLLGCNVTAEILHEIVEEKTSATLRCPHSVEGNVIWSRESHGNKTDILTVNGGGDLKHIHDPGKLYSSLADKSLVIRRVTISDSGRYLCNNEPAVELTVIPSGTIRLNATEGTTITLTCPHDVGGSLPTWSRGSGEIQQEKGFYVSPLDNTLTDVQLGDSGLYYCDGKPTVYLTVIKGTKTPTTLTTMRTPKTRQTSAATPSKAAAPPPATTTVQSTTPLRTTTFTDATTAKKKHQNRKHGEKGKKRGKNTSTPMTTTTTTTGTGTTGTYESTPYLWQMCVRTVIGILYLIIMISITVTTWRKARQIAATATENDL